MDVLEPLGGLLPTRRARRRVSLGRIGGNMFVHFWGSRLSGIILRTLVHQPDYKGLMKDNDAMFIAKKCIVIQG
jgi:hypothetical protein